jgi:hypothetical protein
MSDNVNHPSHYETGKYEYIDVMIETQGIEAVKNFCICNAFKYLYRHENKNGVEDVRKAKWYLDKYLELVDVELAKDLESGKKSLANIDVLMELMQGGKQQ